MLPIKRKKIFFLGSYARCGPGSGVQYMAVDKLRSKVDRDIGKGMFEASTSGSSAACPQVDELTKLVKSLSAEVETLKLEGKKSYRNPPNVDNRDNFKRPNKTPQIIQIDQRNRDRDDQGI
jgi:hypothetical protein